MNENLFSANISLPIYLNVQGQLEVKELIKYCEPAFSIITQHLFHAARIVCRPTINGTN